MRLVCLVLLAVVAGISAQSPPVTVQELCADRNSEEFFRLTTEGDCRDVVRCDRGGPNGVIRLASIKCPAGLAFDLSQQICNWKTKVDNCDITSKPRKVNPNLKTKEPVCPEGQLACGNNECRSKADFCDGKFDCADKSDESKCSVADDPNRAPDCDPSQCQLPECFCSSDGTQIPNGLEAANVPQMVVLTFSGAVNTENIDIFDEIFNGARLNPNDCQIKGTFFVSHQFTNYSAVQDHRRGHEIAAFGISSGDTTSEYWSEGSYDLWKDEMTGNRQIIERFANITDGSVIGVRAPLLAVGSNNQYRMMADNFFVYDASVTAPLGRVPIWPYTLYFRMPHKCHGNGGRCPSKSHGIWEMVINELDRREDIERDEPLPGCPMVDTCTNIRDANDLTTLLNNNFNRHYNTNKAPFGLHFQASFLKDKEKRRALTKFIDQITKKNDVYFVTMLQVIQWMQNPTEVSNLGTFQEWKEKCDVKGAPACSLPETCALTTRELPDTINFMTTCMECPANFPWIKDPVGDDADSDGGDYEE